MNLQFQNNNNPLRTLKETAETLGISEHTLWRLRRNREIGSLTIAGKTYIPQADINSYLERNYTPAAGEKMAA